MHTRIAASFMSNFLCDHRCSQLVRAEETAYACTTYTDKIREIGWLCKVRPDSESCVWVCVCVFVRAYNLYCLHVLSVRLKGPIPTVHANRQKIKGNLSVKLYPESTHKCLNQKKK